jgi:integrase
MSDAPTEPKARKPRSASGQGGRVGPKPPPRRAKGEGSIYEDAKRGRYVGAHTTRDGKRHFLYSHKNETKEQFAVRLREAIDDARGAVTDYRRQTVAAYLTRWLTDHVDLALRPSTARIYRWAVERYLIPSLGTVRLRDLTPDDVDAAMAKWRHRKVGPSTIAVVRTVLRTALERAVKRRVATYNAAALTDAPRKANPNRKALSLEQSLVFRDAVEADEYRALWMVGLMAGLRISEALGLTWSDVDLVAGSLRICHQLARVHDEDGDPEWRLVPVKTDFSDRTVEIPPILADVLRHHRTLQREAYLGAGIPWKDDGLLFTRPDGAPMWDSTVRTRLHRICREAGLPDLVYHELRHTYGMLLRRGGALLEVVQQQMGHSAVSITSGIYGHDQPEAKRTAANSLGELFEGSK